MATAGTPSRRSYGSNCAPPFPERDALAKVKGAYQRYQPVPDLPPRAADPSPLHVLSLADVPEPGPQRYRVADVVPEREIANLARKATKEILMKGTSKVKVRAKNLDKYAGVRRFRFGEAELEDLVGITTGLAWTEVGGELLQIEAVLVPGRGRVSVTGKLGDVMQESVQAANAYVRSRAAAFGIKQGIFEKRDIHVHVPEGATPKDGPSAGVGMITSIVSALTGIAVRKDVAMTGEISLRGRVLPIGGLKEKLLAALRGGLKTVLIPKENERDLPEIADAFGALAFFFGLCKSGEKHRRQNSDDRNYNQELN